jgi:hypothetical protein
MERDDPRRIVLGRERRRHHDTIDLACRGFAHGPALPMTTRNGTVSTTGSA